MRHGNFDVEPGVSSNWRILSHLWPYLLESRNRVLLALLCLLLAKGAILTIPFLLKYLVDSMDGAGGYCPGCGQWYGTPADAGPWPRRPPQSERAPARLHQALVDVSVLILAEDALYREANPEMDADGLGPILGERELEKTEAGRRCLKKKPRHFEPGAFVGRQA